MAVFYDWRRMTKGWTMEQPIEVTGASADVFAQLTRGTIDRYLDDLTIDELVDLLGHLIVRRRVKYHQGRL